MSNEKIKKIILSISLLLLIFIFDRISKILILNILDETGKVDIYINSFLNFYLVWNKGIGFGLLSSEQDNFYNFVTGLIVMINFVIIYMLFNEKGMNSLYEEYINPLESLKKRESASFQYFQSLIKDSSKASLLCEKIFKNTQKLSCLLVI